MAFADKGIEGIIITGGSLEDDVALAFLQGLGIPADHMIAADRGLDFCGRHGIVPGHLVGDFDSANPQALDRFRGNKGVSLHLYPAEKDWTDTELAVRLGISLGWKRITVLGGTGSRIDHVLGNLQTMELALNQGVEVCLLDSHNRIRMIDRELTLDRKDRFGDYISLVPWGGVAEHVTLEGFKYPLTDAVLYTSQSIGISNQFSDRVARIRLQGGHLLVIESRD